MKSGISIFRDRNGVAHIKADNLCDLYWGQGYAHGTDRLMQICLMRVLGQGRICELLHDDTDSLKIDKFFRRLNWSKNVKVEIDKLNVEDHTNLESYCSGINAAIKKRVPWEFRLLGFHPEPFKPKDCLLISRMMGYLTLAQSQAEIQRLFIEMVQAGVEDAKLHALFPDILGGFDRALIEKIQLNERIVNPAALWQQAIPRMMASNNWVISGKRTVSGKPLLANDPHLEGNRLPNIWYENVLIGHDRYMMGASVPGIPGILSGRNNDVSWGVTYAFVDNIDSWVEQCEFGRYLAKDQASWTDFEVRQEVIRRKNHATETIYCYENDHGLLDGDPNVPGFYLATRWAADSGGSASIAAALNMWHIMDVRHMMELVGKIESGWSFVMADSHGSIGFQMSGVIPIRPEGIQGFVPLAGWDAANDWCGFYPPTFLPRSLNPESGYFVTANNDLNAFGSAKPITICMGPYRADRITQLIEQTKKLSPADMYKMQLDLYSLQAEAFMKILKPLLPNEPKARILSEWDCHYDAKSKGAYLFEMFLTCLYHDVFGLHGLGSPVVRHLAKDTSIFVDFYRNFDQVLLQPQSVWFDDKPREVFFLDAALRALKLPPKSWGSVQRFELTNIFFAGQLPSAFGFDKGPIIAVGGRATVNQGQIYQQDGRLTSFMPTLRLVSDMSRHEMHTCLLGGASDRRFSKWYDNEVNQWRKGKYKLVSPIPVKKLKF